MKRSADDKLPSRLSEEELGRLREVVSSLHQGNGGTAPHASFVSLAAAIESPKRVTVDFHASSCLGLPLVVVQIDNEAATDETLQALSPREKSVARLISQGLANKQIAAQLGISLLTVKDHVHRILVKTGLPNRAAVAAASRSQAASDP